MNERENSGSLAARTMSADRILAQLSDLKDTATDPETVTALEAAVSMIAALQDEGIEDAEALKDLLFDYNLASKQQKELHRKFEVPAKAVKRAEFWLCPECGHRVAPKHTHCHWCGKKLGGW